MSKYRVLTMDGGGVRGVMTARFLEILEAKQPGFLAKVDLFAGTSAGSISAVALAMGLTPTQILDLYRTQSAVIFRQDLVQNITALWGLAGAKYTTADRYRGIHPTIGDVQLGQLQKKVLVCSFQLESNPHITSTSEKAETIHSWSAKFFHNFPQDNNGQPNPDLTQKAIDVILRSSAAPTYFPIYQGFVDGGVVANNPSMCALGQAINKFTGGQDIRNLALLSVGTGARPKWIPSRDGNWGITEWGLNLVDLIFESGSGLPDYQCRQLLADCYCRLDAALPQDIALDAADKVHALIDIADAMERAGKMDQALNWLTTQWLPD